MNKKEYLKGLMQKNNLDLILVYSDSHNSAFDLAINKIQPLMFHYYFFSLKEEGFLEIEYLVEGLKKKAPGKVIIPIKEQNIAEEIESFSKNYNRIGLIGNAPFNHLPKVKDKIIDLNSQAEELILIKEKDEIEKITESAKIISRELDSITSNFLVGKTQIQIRDYLKSKLLEKADELAFPICITSKKDIRETTSSSPTNDKIYRKDIIVIDAGVCKDGFYSDCTRMYFIDNKEAEENYKKLLKVQQKIISLIKPGIYLKDISGMYQKELKKANLNPETLEVQDLGHSIGFSLHENPIFYLEEQRDFQLRENMIITLEPEVSMGEYRLRVEDMILVKNNSVILTK